MRESVPSGVLITVLRTAFILASVTWALLLPLAPFIASRAHATPVGAALLLATYAIGGAICHQLPERSYHLWTVQLPVCARCTGIYAGAAMAAIVWTAAPLKRPTNADAAAPLKRRPPNGDAAAPLKQHPTNGDAAAPLERRPTNADAAAPPKRRPTNPDVGHRFSGANRSRALLLMAALPTLATLVYEWTTAGMPAHTIRAAAATPLGATVAWMVLTSMPRRTRADNQVN
jgi:hypothetical protein